MPRTRPAASHDAKAAEILEVAERRLREGGYQALSVAAMARELGLAQNTIYWYFGSKDELFVATLKRILHELAAGKPSAEDGRIDQILWFTDQFQELSDLRSAMNERARHSPVVAEFVAELDARLSRMLSHALADYVPGAELQVAVETFRATVEGTFVKGLDQPGRRQVLKFALGQLIPEEDQQGEPAPPAEPAEPAPPAG